MYVADVTRCRPYELRLEADAVSPCGSRGVACSMSMSTSLRISARVPHGCAPIVRITAKTDYAVRALVELSSLTTASGEAVPATVECLAARQQIGAPFLAVIVGQMRVAGLVRRADGHAAGFLLARPAEEISILHVVDATDALFGTISGRRPEELDYPGAATGLRDVWCALRASTRLALENVTIADVAVGKLP
jgi:Rrf2 family protein